MKFKHSFKLFYIETADKMEAKISSIEVKTVEDMDKVAEIGKKCKWQPSLEVQLFSVLANEIGFIEEEKNDKPETVVIDRKDYL